MNIAKAREKNPPLSILVSMPDLSTGATAGESGDPAPSIFLHVNKLV